MPTMAISVLFSACSETFSQKKKYIKNASKCQTSFPWKKKMKLHFRNATHACGLVEQLALSMHKDQPVKSRFFPGGWRPSFRLFSKPAQHFELGATRMSGHSTTASDYQHQISTSGRNDTPCSCQQELPSRDRGAACMTACASRIRSCAGAPSCT